MLISDETQNITHFKLIKLVSLAKDIKSLITSDFLK